MYLFGDITVHFLCWDGRKLQAQAQKGKAPLVTDLRSADRWLMGE